jgi:cathepsin L
MKLFILFAAIIAATCALSDHQQWIEFKGNFSKQYKVHEEQARFQIFQKNLRKIEEHNAKYENGEETYYMKVNDFADWTQEEFSNMLKAQVSSKPEIKGAEIFKADPSFKRPTSIDWREHNAVLAVKNQGTCGSCWSFSVTGTLEGQLALHKNSQIPLSEQEMVDCDTANSGCSGGDMRLALNFVKNNGLVSEASYPYTGIKGSCRSHTNKVLQTISGFVEVQSNEEALADAVGSIGPISIGLNANTDWQFYGGGIFNHRSCNNIDLNHGVLAVGYDSQAWIIKNSWGPSWGEAGYIRLIRGQDQCGVSAYSTYAKL